MFDYHFLLYKKKKKKRKIRIVRFYKHLNAWEMQNPRARLPVTWSGVGKRGNYILNSNAYYSYSMSKETGIQVEHLNVKTK